MGSCKIGIVTFPLGKQSILPLSNLVGITSHISGQVYIITGNAGEDVAQLFKKPHFDLVSYTVGSNTVIESTIILSLNLK